MNAKEIGHAYEDIACELLTNAGARIVARNFRCKLGEIDIIAQHQDKLLFVEVKYRKNDIFGNALQVLSKKQQHRLKNTALFYCQQHQNPLAMRFDVIGFTGQQAPQWIQNAF